MELEQLNDISHYIGIVLNNWYALTLAIDHNFAGCTPRDTEFKVKSLVEFVTSKLVAGIDSTDLIIELEVVLDNEFNTLLEDDSCPAVVDSLMDIKFIHSKGSLPEMQSLMSRLKTNVPIQQAFTVPIAVPRPPQDRSDEGVEHVEGDEWTQVTYRKR